MSPISTIETVELIVDSTGPQTLADFARRYFDNQQTMEYEATYVLRAIDNTGEIKHVVAETLKTPQAYTSDMARLVAILSALDRLKDKLQGKPAHYKLIIRQSSRNIDGWMTLGWKRNTPTVVKLTMDVENALEQFPDTDWIRELKSDIENWINDAKEMQSS